MVVGAEEGEVQMVQMGQKLQGRFQFQQEIRLLFMQEGEVELAEILQGEEVVAEVVTMGEGEEDIHQEVMLLQEGEVEALLF